MIVDGILDSLFILDAIKNTHVRGGQGGPAGSYSSSLGVSWFSLEAFL